VIFKNNIFIIIVLLNINLNQLHYLIVKFLNYSENNVYNGSNNNNDKLYKKRHPNNFFY